MLWRQGGDLNNATTGLGLHRDRDINSPPTISSEIRRRIWIAVFSIDKVIAGSLLCNLCKPESSRSGCWILLAHFTRQQLIRKPKTYSFHWETSRSESSVQSMSFAT